MRSRQSNMYTHAAAVDRMCMVCLRVWSVLLVLLWVPCASHVWLLCANLCGLLHVGDAGEWLDQRLGCSVAAQNMAESFQKIHNLETESAFVVCTPEPFITFTSTTTHRCRQLLSCHHCRDWDDRSVVAGRRYLPQSTCSCRCFLFPASRAGC